jgi:hypothetical protein
MDSPLAPPILRIIPVEILDRILQYAAPHVPRKRFLDNESSLSVGSTLVESPLRDEQLGVWVCYLIGAYVDVS